MRELSSGDASPLGELFERHHARVYALCFRLTGRADVADDLTQETMLRVLRQHDQFRRESSFATWLYRLTYNVCTDHWRRTRRDEENVEIDGLELSDNKAELNDDRHALLEMALSRLSHDQRAVLVLSRYDGLSYDEIAMLLDCSPGAARVRAHRALNELREIYRELERQQY